MLTSLLNHPGMHTNGVLPAHVIVKNFFITRQQPLPPPPHEISPSAIIKVTPGPMCNYCSGFPYPFPIMSSIQGD